MELIEVLTDRKPESFPRGRGVEKYSCVKEDGAALSDTCVASFVDEAEVDVKLGNQSVWLKIQKRDFEISKIEKKI